MTEFDPQQTLHVSRPTLPNENRALRQGGCFIAFGRPAYAATVRTVGGYRSVWSSIAVVALICNVMASAFCCAPSSLRKTVFIDPVLGAIPLCTTDLGGNSGGKNPGSSKHHCPVCLAAANKALTAPSIALPIAPETFVVASATREDDRAIQQRLRLGGLGSRAPPLSA